MQMVQGLTGQSDRELVQRLREGDNAALDELMRRHDRWVRAIAVARLGAGDEAEEVVHRAWLRFWQRSRELQDLDRWKAWLGGIVRNLAVDQLRRRKRDRSLLQRAADWFGRKPRRSDDPADVLEVSERHREVLAAIYELPENYREAFVLKHLDNLSYRRMAEVLGISEAGVETRLLRARRLLRDKLHESGTGSEGDA